MRHETINRVEVLDTRELLLGITGQGDPIYQYVYREAAGVYWDKKRFGFKSTPMQEWSCSDWYKQIVDVVRTGVGVELALDEKVAWINVPEDDVEEIKHASTF